MSDRQNALDPNGLATRREVLGDAYVDAALSQVDEFSWPMQELVTRNCWNDIWNRPGLARPTRSLINIGMLVALNRPHELKVHLRGALNNGCTEEEILCPLRPIGPLAEELGYRLLYDQPDFKLDLEWKGIEPPHHFLGMEIEATIGGERHIRSGQRAVLSRGHSRLLQSIQDAVGHEFGEGAACGQLANKNDLLKQPEVNS